LVRFDDVLKMSDEDDYESLPASSAVSTHMLAGAAAGIMEHCVMYPVDCVKVCVTVYLSTNSVKVTEI